MTPGGLPERDGADIEALVADRYLDALLAAAERHAGAGATDAMLDPELRRAAGVLRRSLVRVHPSFRFEERLADRLAALARADVAARDEAATGAADGTIAPAARVLAFPGSDATPAAATGTPGRDDPLLEAILAGAVDPAEDAVLDLDRRLASARRPLLVGGAITSAAISLVGVAWVAWRATRQSGRPGQNPLGRAGRAVRESPLDEPVARILGGLS
jgi:hypothetical protein